MLEVRLLGQFEVRRDGEVVAIPSRLAQSLLAYLILSAGTRHRREKLAGLLWPDASEANARSNLRHALWRLRKALGISPRTGRDYLLADEIAVTFDPNAGYCLDVAVLERKPHRAAAPEELMEVVAVYRGELLPGFYDDWALLERERLQAVFEQQLGQLLERLVAAQRWSAVLEWGERWIVLGRVPEPAYRALMVAHANVGDLASVAGVYRRCAEALERELGVTPSPLTRTTYERLAHDKILPSQPASFEEPPAPGEAPFKGLRYFDEADASIFFGRERLTARLAGHLRDHTVLAVVGASGSGKSSLVRAGLVPALKCGKRLADGAYPPAGSTRWPVHVITPTAHPLEALAASLTRDVESVTATATLLDDLARDPRSLHLAVRRLLMSQVRSEVPGTGRAAPAPSPGPGEGTGGGHRLLLVVDQFEELFTLCRSEAERRAFVDNLLFAVAPETGGPTTVVLTLRADFYAHCAQYANLREAVATWQEYIGPMSREELRRAIQEPAQRGGWAFESGLVDLLLRDVSEEPGALPLLSHALLETWQRRRGRRLAFAGYTEAGGVHGAIARTAERVYQQLSMEQQAIARRIFLRLTELGAGTQDTRRRAALAELSPRLQDAPMVAMVLQTLVDARLITTAEGTVEVAHEALIRAWPTLRQWLLENREGLRLQRHLTEAAHEWESLGRDAGALYRGMRLAQVLEWAAGDTGELNGLERQFLAASAEQARREAAEREAQWQRQLAATQRAEHEARRATSRELAAAAISNLAVDPELSILLALRAVSVEHTLEAENALHQAVQASRIVMTLSREMGDVWAVAFSPDGTHLATGSADGTARLWDISTTDARLVFTFCGHTDLVENVAFSPDGTRLATASDDRTAKVWDANGGTELFTLHHNDKIEGLAFSPDGRRLATGAADGTATVWDTFTGCEWLTVHHAGAVASVAFSLDGQRLATAGPDTIARIWDISTTAARLVLTLAGHTPQIGKVAFSPDGTRLVMGEGDGTANVWDAGNGQKVLRLAGHAGRVIVAFSPEGTCLATGAADGTAKLWDAAWGNELFTLAGHKSQVTDLAFSPDGARLATASRDATVKIWDISPGGNRELLTVPATWGAFDQTGVLIVDVSDDSKVATLKSWLLPETRSAGVRTLHDGLREVRHVTLAGHADPFAASNFSPDRTCLVLVRKDFTAHVWDTTTGAMVRTFSVSGHAAPVAAVAFSPDTRRLATASGDKTAKVWDVASGQAVLTLSGHTDAVSSVTFSPDGSRLATASDDGTASVWDAATGTQVLVVAGHRKGIYRVVFSPDGTRLATASLDGTAKVWEAASGTNLLSLSGHIATVRTVAFSRDGTRLATGSLDQTAKIWDATTGQELLTLRSGSYVEFSPDGTRLLGAGGVVRVYVLRLEELVALAQARVTRALTTEECRKYLHLEECSFGDQLHPPESD